MGKEVKRTQQVTPQLNISGNEEKKTRHPRSCTSALPGAAESPPPTGNPEADITASLMLKLMLGVGGTFGAHVTSSFTSPALHPRFRRQNNTLNQ